MSFLFPSDTIQSPWYPLTVLVLYPSLPPCRPDFHSSQITPFPPSHSFFFRNIPLWKRSSLETFLFGNIPLKKHSSVLLFLFSATSLLYKSYYPVLLLYPPVLFSALLFLVTFHRYFFSLLLLSSLKLQYFFTLLFLLFPFSSLLSCYAVQLLFFSLSILSFIPWMLPSFQSLSSTTSSFLQFSSIFLHFF